MSAPWAAFVPSPASPRGRGAEISRQASFREGGRKPEPGSGPDPGHLYLAEPLSLPGPLCSPVSMRRQERSSLILWPRRLSQHYKTFSLLKFFSTLIRKKEKKKNPDLELQLPLPPATGTIFLLPTSCEQIRQFHQCWQIAAEPPGVLNSLCTLSWLLERSKGEAGASCSAQCRC